MKKKTQTIEEEFNKILMDKINNQGIHSVKPCVLSDGKSKGYRITFKIKGLHGK